MRRCHTLLTAFLLLPLLLTSTARVSAAPPAPLTIPQIQGDGLQSPFTGQKLNRPVRGCVTGVAAEGFFLQDPGGDGNLSTSDGIYVYRYSSWRNPRGLKPGDLLEITGAYKVMEFYGQTEIAGLSNDKNQTYRVLGKCVLPAPVTIEPPAMDKPPAEQYEPLEGQRITIDFIASVVGPTQRYESRHLAGDPEITLAPLVSPLGDQRMVDALTVDIGTITLTGGLGVDLPAVNTFDRVTAKGLTGILAYQFGRYVVLVDSPQALQVTPGDLSPASIPPTGEDEWTLCSFNAENLFDAMNDKDGDMGAWAPPDAAAYRRQVERRAALIRERLGGCTVVGLQEVEGKDEVWADLARAVGPSYRYDYWESADARDITVGLLYDSARVEVLGSAGAPTCGPVEYGVDPRQVIGRRAPDYACPAGSFPLFDRAPYVADILVANASGDRRMEVRLVVVHLKSKRGDEAENALRRMEQARDVAALLDAPNSVALGDLNDTLGSAPLAQFEGLTNLFERYVALGDRYTYIYNGRSQAIDHVIMSPGIEAYFAGGQAVHANADFAEPLPQQDGRVSDHDPVCARFLFRPSGLREAALGATSGIIFGNYHHFNFLK
jgi:uncharacterized protein